MAPPLQAFARVRVHVLLILAWSCLATAASAAPAAWDRPTSAARSSYALRSVIASARAAAKRGERPVVVVDIDDTAADGRARLRVAAERAGLPTQHLRSADDLYAGLSGRLLMRKHAEFEKAYFYDAKLGALDTAQRGAPAFLRDLDRAGARVIYVSGRWESLRRKTEAYLRKLDLPLPTSRDLLLNPLKEMHAREWKKLASHRIARAGKPIAFFENEADSIADYNAQFPAARAFRLATFRFHEAPPKKPRGVLVIRDFSIDR